MYNSVHRSSSNKHLTKKCQFYLEILIRIIHSLFSSLLEASHKVCEVSMFDIELLTNVGYAGSFTKMPIKLFKSIS